MVNFGNEWDDIMAGEFELPYYLKLREFLKTEYSTREIYPNMYDIFNAMKHTSYSAVKAVIIGQDPYHEPGQAHGLCFSVKKGLCHTPVPPEHIQGAVQRPGNSPCASRGAYSLGGQRCAASEHGANCAQRCRQFPQGHGLGDIHGSCDRKAEQPQHPHGIPAVGRQCESQERAYHQSCPPCADSRPSLTSFGV